MKFESVANFVQVGFNNNNNNNNNNKQIVIKHIETKDTVKLQSELFRKMFGEHVTTFYLFNIKKTSPIEKSHVREKVNCSC